MKFLATWRWIWDVTVMDIDGFYGRKDLEQ